MNHNYRNTDPPTSALASHDAEANGSAQRHRAMCFDTVMHKPGQTAREIENQLGIKAHKRLPELRRAGLIRNGQPRRCTVTGRCALTWYLRPHANTASHPHQTTPAIGELA